MSNDSTPASTGSIDAPQPAEPTNPTKNRVRVDDKNLTTSYANSYRMSVTAEEAMVDFGVNVTSTGLGYSNDGPPGEIVFTAQNRIFLNHYTAKRLMLTLQQVIANHEKVFGELKMDVAGRAMRNR